MNRIALTLAGAALGVAPMAAAPAAHAEPAQHDWFEESWSGSESFVAGEGPCVDWAGSFHEARSGGYRIVAAPGGQVEDEYHVNGAVHGIVELVPEDPALPSYSGTYREKVNVIVSGYDEERGDLTRVGQYRLRVPLAGTDGSSYLLTMSGKVTMNANGDWTVERGDYSCS